MYERFNRAISVVLAVVSVICSSVICARYGDSVIALADESPVKAVFLGKTADPSEPTAATPAESADQTVSSESTDTKSDLSYSSSTVSSAVSSAAASKKAKNSGKKLGVIDSQFITPYNANTAYNNIYLNNQSGVKVSIQKLIKSFDCGVAPKSKQPQILIVHTHATENYALSDDGAFRNADLARSKDPNNSVIGVGNEVERVLKKAGISVIHSKVLHDDPSYSGSYTRSAATVQKYLKKYPSIKIVLDIHRDAIGDSKRLVKPVTKIDGKAAAQVMICVGSETGDVTDFPNWRQNLSLGLKLQQTMEVLYPGLARALFLAGDRCYNQNLSPGSIIVEFGTNGNSFSEAKYSGTLVGNALVTLIKNG